MKIIDGHVTNSSSASCPVVLAVRKGKSLENLFSEYGIPKEQAGYFKRDNKIVNKYDLEVDDMKEEYDFYFDRVCMVDWGEGSLWEEYYPNIYDWDELVEHIGEEYIERSDELSRIIELFDENQKGRENLVRDDLILLYVGVIE